LVREGTEMEMGGCVDGDDIINDDPVVCGELWVPCGPFLMSCGLLLVF
jgi:hypothetical protein